MADEYLIIKREVCECENRQDSLFQVGDAGIWECSHCKSQIPGRGYIETQVNLLDVLKKLRWTGTDGSAMGFIPHTQKFGEDLRIEDDD